MAGVAFKIADLARALRGAQRGGMKPGRAEIDPKTGKIVIYAAGEQPEPQNDLDKWMAGRAGKAQGT